MDCFVCKNNEVTYFDSFGVEHISEEILEFIGNKHIKTNTFRVQEYNPILCDCFCILLINFMFAGKSLIDYTTCLALMILKKKDKIVLSYFK